jgi:hypothetical protein
LPKFVQNLHVAVQSFDCRWFSRKSGFINHILDDFHEQCLQLHRSRPYSTNTTTLSLSRHFHRRYGNVVVNTLADLRLPKDFEVDVSDSTLLEQVQDSWQSKCFSDLLSKLVRIPKENVLGCLHRIPCHLRPKYNTRSHRPLCVVLLSHICARIFKLVSLSFCNFFQAFFSVLPFNIRKKQNWP